MKKLLAFALVLLGSNTAFAQLGYDDPNYKAFHSLNEFMNEAWFKRSDTKAWDISDPAANGVKKVGCTARLEELAAAQVPDSTIMEIDRDTADLAKGKHTLVEVRKACEHIQRVSYVKEVDGWVISAMQQAKKLEDDSFDIRMFKNCINTYDDAIKAGMSPAEMVIESKQKNPIDGSEFLWSGTIESLKKKWCDVGIEKAKKAQAASEAPYRAVLKNDKLELALKWSLDYWQLPGGTQVTSLKQLAKASVWYSNDGSTEERACNGKEARVLHRYEFDAQHKLLGHTQKDFCGTPPKKAYR
jgi:hypothetical protein